MVISYHSLDDANKDRTVGMDGERDQVQFDDPTTHEMWAGGDSGIFV